MKRFLIISLIALAGCNSNNNNSSKQFPTNLVNNPRSANGMDTVAADRKPIMAFTDTIYDFSNVNENDKVQHDFAFTNTGKTPLIINGAVGSCGCTVADYPHDPVAPGSGGIMKVTFNSAHKKGHQEKSVTIRNNTLSGINMLYIKADITPKGGK